MDDTKFSAAIDRTPACWTCARKHPGAATCEAFTGAIPMAILTGQHQHRSPFPGDGGLRYKRAKES